MSDFSCGTNYVRARPSSNSGRADGVGLADLSVTAARSKVCGPLHPCRGHRGRIATLWLLVMGVNAEAWKEQAAAKGE